MEEDIKILNDYLDENDRKFIEPKRLKILQAIESLINKYKEQEEQIEEYKLNVKEAMHEARENARIFRKEQAKANEYRKMVELMAEYIDFDKMNFNCSSLCVKEGCREECIIDYFRKKAKGE
ncbi:MAG: hypothetical protein IJX99_06540 [Clostridia bacterium]|nr:hypothetical protein [Clostridia bacterium]